MPIPLTAKSLGKFSFLEEVFMYVVLGVPLAGFWFSLNQSRQIHLDDSRLNLAAHAGLIIFPLLWALLFNLKPIVYESSDDDIVLGKPNQIHRLPASWWAMFILWATPVFGAIELGRAIHDRYLPQAQELTTSPGKAVLIMVVIFSLGVFYSTILMSRSDIPPRVSSEGLRTSNLRFHKWEDIHHVSERENLFVVYHRVNPALPAASLYVDTEDSRAILERFLSEHHVEISNAADPAYLLVKIAVALAFMANLLAAFWLRWNTSFSLIAVVLISFGIGIVMTIMLEKYRGVSKYGKYKPILRFDETAEPENNI